MFQGIIQEGAAVAAPVPISPPSKEQFTLRPSEAAKDNKPIQVNVPQVTISAWILRSLPMFGIGAILATSIYFPPDLTRGLVMIGGEVAFTALAIYLWLPKRKTTR